MIFNVPSSFKGSNEGERKVHEKLAQLFPGKKYFALHSVGLSQHQEKVNGECDFVIISDLGIFCLEVKGGPVERKVLANENNETRKKNDLWIYSTYESEESPFEQAEGAIYPIQKALSDNNKSRRYKFAIGRGVIFPDIEFDDKSAEWSDEEVCSRNEFENDFQGYLLRLSNFINHRLLETMGVRLNEKPNYEDMKWALQCIRPEISHMSLIELNSSKDEVLKLEAIQYAFVDQLIYRQINQSIIEGGPGSGKTILLLESIQRIDPTQKILLVCFNKQLSDYLAFRLKENKNVFIKNYHALMEYYCQKDNDEQVIEDERYQDNYFDEILPKKFEDYIVKAFSENKLEKFDWLFIDEGQDFLTKQSMSNLLELIEGDESDRKFVLAADTGLQSSVYNKMDFKFFRELKSKVDHSLLMIRNYRNPKNLSTRAATICNIKPPPTARNFSAPPRIYTYQNVEGALEEKLDEVVENLLRSGILEKEITILTFLNRSKSVLGVHKKKIAGRPTLDLKQGSAWDKKNEGFIPWSTVSSFKGLENEYIILIEAEIDELNDWYKSLIYVTITRARTEFIYLGKRDSLMYNTILGVN